MDAQATARVVLVVDEALLRASIGGGLRAYGWQVWEAGEHAAALMANQHVDVVFTDVRGP